VCCERPSPSICRRARDVREQTDNAARPSDPGLLHRVHSWPWRTAHGPVIRAALGTVLGEGTPGTAVTSALQDVRSVPQMVVVSTRTTTSVGSWMAASATSFSSTDRDRDK
jgi:hypothetical protein